MSGFGLRQSSARSGRCAAGGGAGATMAASCAQPTDCSLSSLFLRSFFFFLLSLVSFLLSFCPAVKALSAKWT